MRRNTSYTWKSRPFFCVIGLHKNGSYENVQGGHITNCKACPYYWYV